eukprot:3973760-Karenia_brevis.AAC.1
MMMSMKHRGEELTKEAARQLQYLGKVCCVDCNAIRDHKSHFCNTCSAGTRQKAPRRGFRIP